MNDKEYEEQIETEVYGYPIKTFMDVDIKDLEEKEEWKHYKK